MRARLWCLGALLVLGRSVHGGDAEDPVPRFRIEILYTVHARIDNVEKLERVRRIVRAAYPDAKFEEPSVAERRTYYRNYRDRLLARAGLTMEAISKKIEEEDRKRAYGEKDGGGEEDLQQRAMVYGYQIVKDQVVSELELRAIYDFLHTKARDDVSLKVIYDTLRAKDDSKEPVCSTEPGKGLVVYRDFGEKRFEPDELEGIEDGCVKFGFSFRPRVTGLRVRGQPPVLGPAGALGDAGEGSQIIRLVDTLNWPGDR